MLIVTPADKAATKVSVAGGKGAALARLVQAGFNVPPFFTVTASAFDSLSASGLTDEFTAGLRAAYADLGGPGVEMAVRSSALGEDSSDASSAGIYTTILGVSDFPALLEAVETCWRSLDDAHAVHYRADRAQSEKQTMGVVVQRLVRGQWSGVSFTVNPVTQALAQVVLNAVPGMGEALVSGEVNPEEIVLDRDDGTELSRVAGASAAAIPGALVQKVWQVSTQVADFLQFAQDIEWTIRDGEVFLLQSRPVTTVAGIFYNRYIEPWRETPAVAEDPEVMWTRAYGDEVWTSPESPLNYSVRNPPGASAGWFGAYLPAHGDKRPLPAACAKTYMSAAYANVEVLRRIYEYHPKIARIFGVVNFFPPSMQEEVRNMPWRWRGRLRRHWQLERRDRLRASIAHNFRYLETLSDPLIEVSDRWFDIDLDSLSLDELRRHLTEDVMPQVALTGTYYAIGVMYHSFDLTFVLTGLLERWFGEGDALYATVSSGLPNSATVSEAQAIWQLTETARAGGPTVLDVIQAQTWSELHAARHANPQLEAFVEEFDAFLRSHRHRGAAYKDIMFRRWGDRPDQLLDLVRAGLRSRAASPATQNAAQAQARIAKQKELLRRCGLRLHRRVMLRWLFRYNQIYMSIRNDHRFYFDRLWYARRRVYLSMGRRLAAAGDLQQPDDVFFLGTNEIDAAFAGQLTALQLQPRIDVRRNEWERTLKAQAPKFLRGYAPMRDAPTQASGEALYGIAASPGVARGRARVVFQIEELTTVEDGDILVTRQTDPGWTPVFSKISGLVLETGGVLAHGTSLCREYGLPCVTVMERATGRVPDGAIVELDGTRGQLSILSASEATTSPQPDRVQIRD